MREAKRRERVVKRVSRKGLGTAVAGLERSSKVPLCVAAHVLGWGRYCFRPHFTQKKTETEERLAYSKGLVHLQIPKFTV